jgi:putative ABC transport system permease protein
MGTPLLQGRDFTAFDKADAPGVVIINSYLAQHHFAGEDPVGKRLEMGFRRGPLEVIGVAADERQESLQTDSHPGMYLPYAQSPTSLPLVLLARSTSDAATVATAVRQQMATLDGQLPVYDVKTMDQVVSTAIARPRFVTLLLAVFAGVAVLLATIGIYGVMSYTVAQNTREIGIRLALGAQQGDVLKLVVGQGLVLTMLGVMIGLACAFGLTRLMANLLYGVTATDPITFVAVPALLLAVSLFACYVPASRAAKVDPMFALRCE